MKAHVTVNRLIGNLHHTKTFYGDVIVIYESEIDICNSQFKLSGSLKDHVFFPKPLFHPSQSIKYCIRSKSCDTCSIISLGKIRSLYLEFSIQLHN